MHPVFRPEAKAKLLRRRLAGDQDRDDGLVVAGDMEILEVERIAIGLLNGMAGKGAFADLVFKHQYQRPCNDHGIGASSHAGDGEFHEEMGIGQNSRQLLEMGDRELPGTDLCQLSRKLGCFGEIAEDQLRRRFG
nr:hypothetical protein [uncultured Sandarakinorhabdus sp.]